MGKTTRKGRGERISLGRVILGKSKYGPQEEKKGR